MPVRTIDPSHDDRDASGDGAATTDRSRSTASRVQPHVDAAAERARDTIDAAGARAHAGIEAGQARAGAAVDAAEQFEQKTLDAIDETTRKLTRYVREKPLQAAGIAFAAGVVTALLLRRRG